jgi:hypothetical protein
MEISIIKNIDFKVHPFADKLSGIFKANIRLTNYYSLLANVCCYVNQEINIFYINPDSEFCHLLKSEIEDAYAFFIRHFIDEKYIDLKTSHELLKLALFTNFADVKMFELFNILHWPSSKKGLDYLKGMEEFSDKLKNLVLNKKISIKEAYLLNKTFTGNYDDFLELLPERLTYTESGEAARYISEYGKREKKSIGQIVASLKGVPENEILDFIYRLRYPLFSEFHGRFINFIKELNLPKDVKVDFDKTFENDNYVLNVKFKDARALIKKMDEIVNKLDSYVHDEKQDFFIHENLFKNDK